MSNRRVKTAEAPSERTVRASISFPEKQYMELERIAEQKNVSLAWVVREAISEFLRVQWPLLENNREHVVAQKETSQ